MSRNIRYLIIPIFSLLGTAIGYAIDPHSGIFIIGAIVGTTVGSVAAKLT